MEIRWIERMMVRELTTLEGEIAALKAIEDLWVTPPGVSNSIGTLALHLAGNLRHFVGAVLGKTGFVRQRDLEFSTRGLSATEVLAQVAEAKRVVSTVLVPERNIDLSAEFPEAVGGAFRVTTGDFLIHLVAHLAFHVGQVGYLRRIHTGKNTPVPSVALGALASARKV